MAFPPTAPQQVPAQVGTPNPLPLIRLLAPCCNDDETHLWTASLRHPTPCCRPIMAHRLLHRLGGGGVSVTAPSARQARLVVTRDLQRECTISTQEPVRAPGRHGFSVSMPLKEVRTAVGFLAAPSDQYMTPDFGLGSRGYVSYGGAGFIYPAKRNSGVTYGQGDTVRAELDFDARVVTFWANGRKAGTAPWTGGDEAYPAVSVFPGALRCEVEFDQ